MNRKLLGGLVLSLCSTLIIGCGDDKTVTGQDVILGVDKPPVGTDRPITGVDHQGMDVPHTGMDVQMGVDHPMGMDVQPMGMDLGSTAKVGTLCNGMNASMVCDQEMNASCITFTGTNGTCGVDGCTQDNTQTTMVNEDNCGMGNQCVGLVDGMGMQTTSCFKSCTPVAANSRCGDPGVACGPDGLCVGACTGDMECQQGTDTSHYCNMNFGSCLVNGKMGAAVGDPCAADADCTKNGVCLPSQIFPGGYCTIPACKLGGDLDCGMAATCIQLDPMSITSGLCFKNCTMDTDCTGMMQKCVDASTVPGGMGVMGKVCFLGM